MKISGPDLHLFAVFDCVVRNGGLSAAQAELGLSQPTISNHLTALEERLGVRLCQRGRKGFLLTEQGRSVHEITSVMLHNLEDYSSRLTGLKGSLAGWLRIATVDCLATDRMFKLPEVINAIVQKAPAIRLQLSIERPQDILSGVAGGAFHLGIGSYDNRINGLSYTDLYDEPHAVYCGKAHPLFKIADADVTLDQIYEFPWVHRGYWNRQRQKTFKLIDADRIVDDIEAQFMMVLSGSYVGLLPEHAAAFHISSGRLRKLPANADSYSCKIQVVTRSGPNTKTIAFAVEALRKHYNS